MCSIFETDLGRCKHQPNYINHSVWVASPVKNHCYLHHPISSKNHIPSFPPPRHVSVIFGRSFKDLYILILFHTPTLISILI